MRVTANSAGDYVNLEAVMAYSNNTKHIPTNGTVVPPYDANNLSQFGWQNLVEDVGDTFAHSGGGQGSYVQLDYGRNVPIDKIVIVNRRGGAWERAVGTTVSIIKAEDMTSTGVKNTWSAQINSQALFYTFRPPSTTVTAGSTPPA